MVRTLCAKHFLQSYFEGKHEQKYSFYVGDHFSNILMLEV